MKKKIMAVLLVFAVFFTLGCAGVKNNDDAPASTPAAPTVTPEPENNDPVPSATPQASGNPVVGPTVEPVQETGTYPAYYDPSLADISPGEDDEFFDDIGLPTPGAE
ncbi:hypothetical protein CUJ83_10325 [Methanocella sp. CWC-04]|uniref:Uncharacterized protein n=1 Tax=Methanooceanicella nereidis TaxID=2052831 RepID=A0AAP2W6J2_9EURY|nr:hypothetical protein [Methanocella sp. CWC-04]MCD1295393.1 hypothetical protein [Methanocella sp. CWC-04]